MDREKLIQDYLSDRLKGERLDYFNQLIETDKFSLKVNTYIT